MAMFRRVARKTGVVDRCHFIKSVSEVIGYQRLSAKVYQILSNHMLAAVRRNILATDKQDVWLATSRMANFDRDDLVRAIASTMRKFQLYEREDVCHAVALHLDFRHLKRSVADPIKRAIRHMIRKGVIQREQGMIRRVESL